MDRYSITARVYPMLLFFLPISVIFIITIGNFKTYYESALQIGLISVLTYLLSHIGRDAGKKKEAYLWSKWGGPPTTQLFRWSNGKIDKYTKSRNHSKMTLLCPVNIHINEEFETRNKSEADEIYSSWTKYIIGHTRDKALYPLIFKENISYGFRRNLLGLKPYAITLTTILISSIYFYFVYSKNVWLPLQMPNTFIISEILLFFILFFWIFKVTENWVSSAAFSYAERLHDAIAKL